MTRSTSTTSIRTTSGGVTRGSATRSNSRRVPRVGRLILFHHDPYHTDDDLEAMLAAARLDVLRPDDWVCLAHEGMTVEFNAAVRH